MKLEINMPDVEKGTELQVMHVGIVKQGDTVELTDTQVASFRDAGYDMPADGTMKLYQEAPATKEVEVRTTNLPGIEDVAEKERAKTTRKTAKEGDK